MPDEITYDRVEEAEKVLGDKIDGIGTKVDNINSSVEGLPASLETDFTEVKDAIADVKTDTETNLPQKINVEIEQVRSDISQLLTVLESIQSNTGNITLPSDIPNEKIFYSEILNSNSYGTILSVTGKGYIKEIFAGNDGSVTVKLKITIDGKPFIFTSLGSGTPVGILAGNNGFINSDARLQTKTSVLLTVKPIYNFAAIANIKNNSSTKYIPLTKDDFVSGKTFNKNEICVCEKYIKFEQSLKIEAQSVTTSDPSDAVYCYYGLLD